MCSAFSSFWLIIISCIAVLPKVTDAVSFHDLWVFYLLTNSTASPSSRAPGLCGISIVSATYILPRSKSLLVVAPTAFTSYDVLPTHPQQQRRFSGTGGYET
jgi:hypothetical protein